MMKFAPSNLNGLASSVSFTPLKGIELENPDSLNESEKGHDKYFSNKNKI
jgi:hypothetical protein